MWLHLISEEIVVKYNQSSCLVDASFRNHREREIEERDWQMAIRTRKGGGKKVLFVHKCDDGEDDDDDDAYNLLH